MQKYNQSPILTALIIPGLLLALQSCRESKLPESISAAKDVKRTDNQTVLVAPVSRGILSRTLELPAELEAFRDVKVHAKLKAFVVSVNVDRGSRVHTGDLLIKLTAPELDAQCQELSARISEAQASKAEAISTLEADKATLLELKAKHDSDKLTLARLKKAAGEPGAIAQNEVDTAAKTAEADEARVNAAVARVEASGAVVHAKAESIKAAENSLKAVEEMRKYLQIRAPFDGLIVERWVHEGDMAGVEGKRSEESHPLLRMVDTAVLRLVVSVPEADASGIKEGTVLTFSVPAYLGHKFKGTVARVGHALDSRTRTMPVELDVDNRDGRLEPGMFATVDWNSSRPYKTCFVPLPAVASNLERTFVVRVKDGKVELVPVKVGQTMDDKIEVVGDLKEGDTVILKASDEFKTGAELQVREATSNELAAACSRRVAASGE